MKKDFPYLEFNVRDSELTKKEAYILADSIANAKWERTPDTNAVIDYYNHIISHTGYFAVCGIRGCIRAYNDVLEKAGRTENKSHNAYYKN